MPQTASEQAAAAPKAKLGKAKAKQNGGTRQLNVQRQAQTTKTHVLTKKKRKSASAFATQSSEPDEDEEGLRDRVRQALINLRKAVVAEDTTGATRPYAVFGTIQMDKMAKERPRTTEQLRNVDGISGVICNKFGSRILQAISNEIAKSSGSSVSGADGAGTTSAYFGASGGAAVYLTADSQSSSSSYQAGGSDSGSDDDVFASRSKKKVYSTYPI